MSKTVPVQGDGPCIHTLVTEGVKALSVRTPWAHLIVSGHKDVENRTWTTDYRGPLLIHAGYTLSPDGFAIAAKRGIALAEDAPRGGLIGLVDLVDIQATSASIWYAPHHFAWILENPQPLPFVLCRGRLGLFSPKLGQTMVPRERP